VLKERRSEQQARLLAARGGVEAGERVDDFAAESSPTHPRSPSTTVCPTFESAVCGNGKEKGVLCQFFAAPDLTRTDFQAAARIEAAPEQQKAPISGLSLEADDGARTHDLLHGKQTLCQLSYIRIPAKL
jgi:hypothetical protein